MLSCTRKKNRKTKQRTPFESLENRQMFTANLAFDFENVAIGTQYGGNSGNSPGDTVMVGGCNVEMSVVPFDNGTFGDADIAGHPGPPTSSFPVGVNPTNALNLNQIAAEFDFQNVPYDVGYVKFEWSDTGVGATGENLSINGQPLFLGEIDSVPQNAFNGFSVTVTSNQSPSGIANQLYGTVEIAAHPGNTIDTVLVGSEGEFAIDNLVKAENVDVAFSTNPNFGDFDLDGSVDFGDFLVLSANFGGSGGPLQGDTNGDLTIDFGDFIVLSSNFGSPIPAQGVTAQPSGLATIDRIAEDFYQVSNIEDSGQDGISFELNENQETVSLKFAEPIALQPDSQVSIEATAIVDGESVPAGFATVEHNGAEVLISAELSYGQDVESVLVQVYQGNDLVGEEIVEAGVVGSVEPVDDELAIQGWGKLFPDIDELYCYRIDLPGDVIYNSVTGEVFEGDQIRLLVPDGAVDGVLEGYTDISITGRNLDPFAIQRPTGIG